MATATGPRGLALPRLHRRVRVSRPVIVVSIIAVMVVLYPMLRNSHPWPQSLVYGLNARLDEVYNWIVLNQGSSWIYVYVLNPISNFLNWLVTEMTNLLNGLTWVGVPLRSWDLPPLVRVARVDGRVRGALRVRDHGALDREHADAGADGRLRLGRARDRDPPRDRRRPQQRLQQGDHAGPRRDADHSGVRVPHARGDPVLGRQPGAVIVTVIYAMPPAVRITALGIRGVPENSVEAADSMGATQMQVLGKVQLPLARRTLMLAVNQTIMMALSMVVIASLIGGAGLGDTIISSLTYLDVGSAAIGGAAIVFLAIALDRATAAAGERVDHATHHTGEPAAQPRHLALLTAGGIAVVVVSTLVARALGAGAFPSELSARGDLVSWINSAVAWAESPSHPIYPGDLELRRLPRQLAARAVALVHGGHPVVAHDRRRHRDRVDAVGLASGDHRRRPAHRDRRDGCLARRDGHGVAGDRGDDADADPGSRGRNLGVGVGAGRAPDTSGPRCAADAAAVRLPRAGRRALQRGPGAGVIASVLYAAPVVIRLVTAGLRDVSATAVEAASSFGASRMQLLLKVKIPLARPAIMLGINQGIIMVLAVVIVAGSWAVERSATASSSGSSGTQFGDGVVASHSPFCVSASS